MVPARAAFAVADASAAIRLPSHHGRDHGFSPESRTRNTREGTPHATRPLQESDPDGRNGRKARDEHGRDRPVGTNDQLPRGRASSRCTTCSIARGPTCSRSRISAKRPSRRSTVRSKRSASSGPRPTGEITSSLANRQETLPDEPGGQPRGGVCIMRRRAASVSGGRRSPPAPRSRAVRLPRFFGKNAGHRRTGFAGLGLRSVKRSSTRRSWRPGVCFAGSPVQRCLGRCRRRRDGSGPGTLVAVAVYVSDSWRPAGLRRLAGSSRTVRAWGKSEERRAAAEGVPDLLESMGQARTEVRSSRCADLRGSRQFPGHHSAVSTADREPGELDARRHRALRGALECRLVVSRSGPASTS